MSTNPLGVHALVFAGGTTPDDMTAIIDHPDFFLLDQDLPR